MVDRYAGEKLDCDIVMKGGITSGVVYPGAIAELAARYRFRAIGGTSAGAIAAAVVAAAEHRRQQGGAGATEGFRRVQELPEALAVEHDGDLQLLRLFQPDPQTAGLFRVMTAFMKQGRWGGLAQLWPAFADFAWPGLALVALALLLGLTGVVSAAIAVVLAVLGLVALLAAPVVGIVDAVRRLPGNFFGLCTLGPGSVGDGPALTEWLHEQIQEAAGRAVDGPVLTFADLWGVDPEVTDLDARVQAMVAPSRDASLRTVDLQMMTTDLTHGRPRRLPAPYQDDDGRNRLEEGGGLLFDRAELARFFPEPVVAHLMRMGKPIGDDRRALLPEGGARFHRFPIGPDLPVVVATRMSLSFPGLISAVPLWDIDFEQEARPPVRVLFSDGGITSNFPVHFFDSPLPRRPTFGLNLTTFPRGEQPPVGVDAQARAVREPPAPSGRAPELPRDVETLPQFLVAVKDAMQNWRDNLQARQPGFRDRIVPIMLGPGEGGMTLTMSQGKIRDLSARGGEAAKVLLERFATDGADAHTAWNDHRFVRLRVTMAVTEQYMKAFRRAYAPPPGPAPGIGPATLAITMPYPQRVAAATAPPYAMTAAQREAAPAVAETYGDAPPDEAHSLVPGAPRPPAVLRIIPPT